MPWLTDQNGFQYWEPDEGYGDGVPIISPVTNPPEPEPPPPPPPPAPAPDSGWKPDFTTPEPWAGMPPDYGGIGSYTPNPDSGSTVPPWEQPAPGGGTTPPPGIPKYGTPEYQEKAQEIAVAQLVPFTKGDTIDVGAAVRAGADGYLYNAGVDKELIQRVRAEVDLEFITTKDNERATARAKADLDAFERENIRLGDGSYISRADWEDMRLNDPNFQKYGAIGMSQGFDAMIAAMDVDYGVKPPPTVSDIRTAQAEYFAKRGWALDKGDPEYSTRIMEATRAYADSIGYTRTKADIDAETRAERTSTARESIMQVVPFEYLRKGRWQQLQGWEKVVYPISDVAMLIPVAGLAGKGIAGASRGLSAGAKVAALGGKEAVNLALRDATVGLEKASVTLTAKRALVVATEDALKISKPATRTILARAVQIARQDASIGARELAQVERNVASLRVLAEAANEGGMGAKVFAGASKVSRVTGTAAARIADVGGSVLTSGAVTAVTVANWKDLTPAQRGLGLGIAVLASGIVAPTIKGVRNVGESVLNPYKIPKAAIAARRTGLETDLPRPGRIWSEKGGKAGGTTRLIIDESLPPEEARDAMADIMRQLYEGKTRTANVRYGPHDVSLPGTGFQEAVGGRVSFSATPMGDIFKEGTGAFGKKTRLEQYLTDVNQKLSEGHRIDVDAMPYSVQTLKAAPKESRLYNNVAEYRNLEIGDRHLEGTHSISPKTIFDLREKGQLRTLEDILPDATEARTKLGDSYDNTVRQLKDKRKVTIYRTERSGMGGELYPGSYVTTSPKAALDYATQMPFPKERVKIYRMEVSADELALHPNQSWAGQTSHINEFLYAPKNAKAGFRRATDTRLNRDLNLTVEEYRNLPDNTQITIETRPYNVKNLETGTVESVTTKTVTAPGVTIKGAEGGQYVGQAGYFKFTGGSASGGKGKLPSMLAIGGPEISKLPAEIRGQRLGTLAESKKGYTPMAKEAIEYFDGTEDVGKIVEGFKRYKISMEGENVVINGTQEMRVQNLRSKLADKLKQQRGEYYTRDSQGRIELFQMYIEGGRTTPYTLKELYRLKGNALRNALEDISYGLRDKARALKTAALDQRGDMKFRELDVTTKEDQMADAFKKLDGAEAAGRLTREEALDARRAVIDNFRRANVPPVRARVYERMAGTSASRVQSIAPGAPRRSDIATRADAPTRISGPENVRPSGLDRIDRTDTLRTAEVRAPDTRAPEVRTPDARLGEDRPPRVDADRPPRAGTTPPLRTDIDRPPRPDDDRPPRSDIERPIRPDENRPPRDDFSRIPRSGDEDPRKRRQQPPTSEDELRRRIADADTKAAWVQGELNGKAVVHVVFGKDGQYEHAVVMGAIPEGVVMAEGKGQAYRTMRLTEGIPPSRPVTFEGGAVDPTVYPTTDDRGVEIRFARDPDNKPPKKDKEKPMFRINRKGGRSSRGFDLGADIVRDRRGRHLRL